ncbi:hypothetical protein C5C03_00365 [Clavibacter michiganensis]|uniref:hypothetical protein n=1 Tax=Clavibacter michiganensis TaxID=28447 RepID=UPI000CE8B094|nr:hypothetical protein [Clavibacter michiganensis]PPF91313.1 hypothetical protein C5C03_00365 [Clavibacter michiganensis]PPF99354.1 hypothetical protein C5C05_02165 [Clavibacter michiganensis]
MFNLLLGWLPKVNPTVALLLALIVVVVFVVVATLAYIVILGPSDVPIDRVVRLLEVIIDMITASH